MNHARLISFSTILSAGPETVSQGVVHGLAGAWAEGVCGELADAAPADSDRLGAGHRTGGDALPLNRAGGGRLDRAAGVAV